MGQPEAADFAVDAPRGPRKNAPRMAMELGRVPREVRRAVTLSAMWGALLSSRALPPRAALALGAALGAAAGAVPPLRMRLSRNLLLGLGKGSVPRGAATSYFRNLGRWFGWSMATYHRGFLKSTLPERMSFHASIANMDEAAARGRGVILASPHQFCHEIGAGYINTRHPVVAVVREGKSRAREAMKRRWYEATGMGIVQRPRRASIMADTFACLRVLKSGRLLAITPDVIVKPESGAPAEMFGRTVSLSPGLVVLAMKARAPLVTCYFRWEEDGRLELRFTEPVEFRAEGDRDRTIAEGLQAWCRQCEEYFRTSPGNWMFWLDKRWTRALRTLPPKDAPA